MHTTTAGKDPQSVVDIEIFLKNLGDDLSSETGKGPASLTNLCSGATLSDIIVGVHIDIKHHLFFLRDECFLVSLQVTLR